MDEPVFLGDWLPLDPPDDEDWIFYVDDSSAPPDFDWIARSLMLAIEANDLKEVQALLASGLSPNLCDSAMPMLSIACLRGAAEIVKVLLEAGAHPNLEYYGYTPLFYAIQAGHFEIVQDLVEAGAKVDGFIISSTYHDDNRKIFEYLLDFFSDEELLLYLSQEDLKSILGFEFDEQPYKD